MHLPLYVTNSKYRPTLPESGRRSLTVTRQEHIIVDVTRPHDNSTGELWIIA